MFVCLKGMVIKIVLLAKYNWLKVRIVTPGFTKTPKLDVFDPRYLEMIQAQNKILTPEEVTRLIKEKMKS